MTIKKRNKKKNYHKMVSFSLSDDQYLKLMDKCKRKGVSRSNLLRELVSVAI